MVMDQQHQQHPHAPQASPMQQQQSGANHPQQLHQQLQSPPPNAGADNSPVPTPQSVGREFVRQYYTLLNQAPLHLHRFYSHNSSFVHGGMENGGNPEPVKGQQEIHQKIMQLNFRDCHAKIRQVDAHSTLGNGVVVQVSGELSNNGQAMRRFMQTFVLAPQSPKKYYVHNDIFRYQDEVFSEEESNRHSSIIGGNANSSVASEAPIDVPPHQAATPPSSGPPSFANNTSSSDDSTLSMDIAQVVPQQQHNINGGSPRAVVGHPGHEATARSNLEHEDTGKAALVASRNTTPTVSLAAVTEQEEALAKLRHDQASAMATPASGISQHHQAPVPRNVSPQQLRQRPTPDEDINEVVNIEKPILEQEQIQDKQQQAKTVENGKTAPSNETLTYANLVKGGATNAFVSTPKTPMGGGPPGGPKPPDSIKDGSGPFSAGKYRGGMSGGGGRGGGGGGGAAGMQVRSGLPPSNPGRERYGPPGVGTNREVGEVPSPGQEGQDRRRLQSTTSNSYSGGGGGGGGGSITGSTGGGPQYTDGQQLFVGNLPHNCTEAELEKLFSLYGPVADIRINSKGANQTKTMPSGARVPNFGFVVFEDESSVAECLKHRPIMLPPNDHRLNVEEKKNKIRSENSGGGPGSLGNSNHRGGFERGSQEHLTGMREGNGGGGGRGGGSDRGGRGGSNMRGGGPSGGRGGGPPSGQKGSSNNQSFRKKSPFAPAN